MPFLFLIFLYFWLILFAASCVFLFVTTFCKFLSSITSATTGYGGVFLLLFFFFFFYIFLTYFYGSYDLSLAISFKCPISKSSTLSIFLSSSKVIFLEGGLFFLVRFLYFLTVVCCYLSTTSSF